MTTEELVAAIHAAYAEGIIKPIRACFITMEGSARGGDARWLGCGLSAAYFKESGVSIKDATEHGRWHFRSVVETWVRMQGFSFSWVNGFERGFDGGWPMHDSEDYMQGHAVGVAVGERYFPQETKS